MILQKLHWAVFACGAALLAVAAVGAARGWNSTELWPLVIGGLACLLIALVAHRLTGITVKHGEIAFTLDEKVREDLTETGLAGTAGTYSFIHNQLGKDPALSSVKIRLQDQVVQMVQENAFSQSRKVDSDKVNQVLSSGSPAERVLVFGLLQRDRTLVTVERLRTGIMESRSGNEQYYALLATLTHLSTFSEGDRELLHKFVRTAPYINEDPDRRGLADKILAS